MNLLFKGLKRNSGFLFILPSFFIITVIYIIPLFMNGYFSFTNYNVIQPPEWIGTGNFTSLGKDPYFKTSVINTAIYTAIVVPIQTVFALVLANLIATFCRDKFGNFIKSSLFIPVISSMILVGVIWRIMLGTESGIINNLLGIFGISGLNWLGDKYLAMISISIVSIWKNVGYFLVIYYAGIMDIPKSYYEAAKVDGASHLQQFRYITLPSLKPITFLVVTLGTIWSFQVFDLVYVMTGGGPGTSTLTLVLYIYQTAFKQFNMGYASAISFILLLLILVVSGLQNLLFREKNAKGGS